MLHDYVAPAIQLVIKLPERILSSLLLITFSYLDDETSPRLPALTNLMIRRL